LIYAYTQQDPEPSYQLWRPIRKAARRKRKRGANPD
jgi:hypothetical protein